MKKILFVMLMLIASFVVFAEGTQPVLDLIDGRFQTENGGYFNFKRYVKYYAPGRDVIMDLGFRNHAGVPFNGTNTSIGLNFLPAIEFYTQFPISHTLLLGIAGYFYNTVNSVRTETQASLIDPTESVTRDIQSYGKLYDELAIVLGVRAIENVEMGFYLGGGIRYNEYTLKTIDKGFKDVLTPQNSTEIVNGHAFVYAGGGAEIAGDAFNNQIENLRLGAELKVRFAGDGDNTTDGPFKIAGVNWGEGGTTYIYKENGTVEEQEVRKWLNIDFSGWFTPTIRLDDKYEPFEVMDNFTMYPGFEFNLGSYIPIQYEYQQGNDPVTTYNITNFYGFVRPSIGMMIEPNSTHRVNVKYALGFRATTTNYYTTSDGANSDKFTNNEFILQHDVKFIYRVTWPSIVYTEFQVDYWVKQSWNQYIQRTYDEYLITDNVVSNVLQGINPAIRIGLQFEHFEIVFGWVPAIIISEEYTQLERGVSADTNILNLANWDFAMKLQFDSEKLQ